MRRASWTWNSTSASSSTAGSVARSGLQGEAGGSNCHVPPVEMSSGIPGVSRPLRSLGAGGPRRGSHDPRLASRSSPPGACPFVHEDGRGMTDGPGALDRAGRTRNAHPRSAPRRPPLPTSGPSTSPPGPSGPVLRGYLRRRGLDLHVHVVAKPRGAEGRGGGKTWTGRTRLSSPQVRALGAHKHRTGLGRASHTAWCQRDSRPPWVRRALP